MSTIRDPLDKRDDPYDLLRLDHDADRLAIDRALGKERPKRPREGRALLKAHEQLSRSERRLRVDLLFYSLEVGLEAIAEGIAEPEFASLSAPLPAVPVAALVDLDAILAAFPAVPPVRDIATDILDMYSRPPALVLPVVFDR